MHTVSGSGNRLRIPASPLVHRLLFETNTNQYWVRERLISSPLSHTLTVENYILIILVMLIIILILFLLPERGALQLSRLVIKRT